MGELPSFISTINWVFTGLLLVTTCLHSKLPFLHVLVCPMLTVITYLYISFVDYDYTVGSIYYS